MKQYQLANKEDIILRDYLARDRTVLANHRTFLAYIRTALGFFGAGIAGIKLVSDWPVVYHICLLLMYSALPIFIVGVVRYLVYARRLRSIPDNHLIADARTIKADDAQAKPTSATET